MEVIVSKLGSLLESCLAEWFIPVDELAFMDRIEIAH